MENRFLAPVGALVAICVSFCVAFGMLAIWHASQAVHVAAEDVQSEQEIPFVIRPMPPVSNPGFELIRSRGVFGQVARFQDQMYVAGAAGLAEYDSSGMLLHEYDVGRDIPGSPLIAIAAATLSDSPEPELILVTANDGLLAFNGRSFRQILPSNAEARGITAILPVRSGHLLIGTKKLGVLVYDGKNITVLHPTLRGLYVTALAGNESDLWIGSLNRGVLHFHAGETDSLGEADGMPDANVQSLAILADTIYVGTANGVAVFIRGHFVRVLAPGVLATAILATPTHLYVGSEDQGIITIPLQRGRPHPSLENNDSQLHEVHQLFESKGTIFAAAHNGVFQLSLSGLGWQQVLQNSATLLSDRNISALAADSNGHLWVGYFDRGIDILTQDFSRFIHVEDEHLFCVNRIFPESHTGIIDVATANGLVRFDNAGKEQKILTRADGLIADHVTDVVVYRDGLALATPAGLTFLDASGARSLYAFQGLVNNHVYALGVSGDALMAGTLGGLSVLNRDDVVANYTTLTSNLKHNWITAVVPVGDEWMVGTYGGGILNLDHSGHFHSFDTGTGAFEVNPNAMLVTSSYVIAGTLGNGLYLYDRLSGRWSVIRDGLPSTNVTALAAANGYIYVGTDNGLVRIPEQKLHA